jgi:type VI secretion system secreted protein VgrG
VKNVSAKQFGEGLCAKHVRLALAAGGLKPITWPEPAKDWGPTLLSLGFTQVSDADYTPLLGDIIVIQPPKGNASGHMEGYDGTNWVSDFVQREMWPGPSYRAEKPAYTIYRRN